MKRKAVTLQLEGEIPQPQSAYDLAVEDGYEGSEEQYGKELATIPPTQEQFDAIPGRISKLTITTEKSDFHHITDSAASKVADFGMEGKTEQETTSGKNFLDISITSQTINGLTINVNEDKSIQIKGTATADTILFLLDINRRIMLKPDNYILTGCPTGGSATTYLLKILHSLDYITDNGKGASFTLEENTEVYVTFTIINGITMNTTLYPMIRLATETDATYEPYTNGPSPNPDYPQEIVNAGVYNEATGRYEIGCSVGNGNLLPSDHNEWFLNHGSAWGARPGTKPSIDRGYTYNSCIIIDVRPDTPVCFHNDTTDKYWVNRIIEIDNDGIGLSQIGLYGNESYNFKDYSFKTSSKTHKLIIDVRLVDKTQTFTEADLQEMKIIFGYDDSVTYTPHQSQQFTLTSPVPLTKWDYLTKRDGVWGWSVYSEEIFLKDYRFNFYGNEFQQTSFLPFKYESTEGVCKYLRCSFMNHKYPSYCIRFDNQIWIYGVGFTTNEEINQWISDNDVSIIHKRKTEVAFHPLPDEEQELLNNLETYYGVTNLYNDQGCPMWLSYVQDTKIAVDNKFNNIKTAILALGGNV